MSIESYFSQIPRISILEPCHATRRETIEVQSRDYLLGGSRRYIAGRLLSWAPRGKGRLVVTRGEGKKWREQDEVSMWWHGNDKSICLLSNFVQSVRPSTTKY